MNSPTQTLNSAKNHFYLTKKRMNDYTNDVANIHALDKVFASRVYAIYVYTYGVTICRMA